jgi:hypothetical protein
VVLPIIIFLHFIEKLEATPNVIQKFEEHVQFGTFIVWITITEVNTKMGRSQNHNME